MSIPRTIHKTCSFKAWRVAADIFCVYTKGMPKERGRPRKKPMDRREQRLDLRVSECEKATFKLAAEAANQDLSVWVRIILRKAASEMDLTAQDPHEGH